MVDAGATDLAMTALSYGQVECQCPATAMVARVDLLMANWTPWYVTRNGIAQKKIGCSELNLGSMLYREVRL
jgi:hypothetical protein